MYLQPDDADRIGRTDPEGYAYARSSPTTATDRTGASSRAPSLWPWPFSIDASCAAQEAKIRAAVSQAYAEIAKCERGECGGSSTAAINFKRQWMFAMLTGNYYCSRVGHPLRMPALGKGADGPWVTFNPWTLAELDAQNKPANWEGMLNLRDGNGTEAFTEEGLQNFIGGRNIGLGETISDGSCLARVVGHEAAHGVFNSLPREQRFDKGADPRNGSQFFAPYYGGFNAWRSGNSESQVRALEKCITCKD